MCRVRECMKKKRLQLKMSQEAAARKAGISFSMWSAVEKGARNPSMQVARKIAHVLHATIDELFNTA